MRSINRLIEIHNQLHDLMSKSGNSSRKLKLLRVVSISNWNILIPLLTERNKRELEFLENKYKQEKKTMKTSKLKTYDDFETDSKYWNYINQTAVYLADNVNDPTQDKNKNAHTLVYDSGWFSDCDEGIKTDLYNAVSDRLHAAEGEGL